jgi:hypothetical protein
MRTGNCVLVQAMKKRASFSRDNRLLLLLLLLC